MLSEAREDLQHADGKASILLAALGIGFGAVLGGQLSSGFNPNDLVYVAQCIFWTGVLSAAAGVAFSALAVWPRYNLKPSSKSGVTYWGHVAIYQDKALFHEALAQPADPVGRIEDQLYFVSRSVLAKFRLVRAALVCSAVAAGLLFVAIALF